MSVISLAVIGKNRIPIYLTEFCRNNTDTLDADAELFGLPSSSSSSPELVQPPVPSPLSNKTLLTHTSNNSESFLSCNHHCSIRQQFILHDALDRLEQKLLHGGYGTVQRQPASSTQQQQPTVAGTSYNNSNSTSMPPLAVVPAHDAMFVGLLCSMEDMRVYGTVAHLLAGTKGTYIQSNGINLWTQYFLPPFSFFLFL
jgi:hypothetical protein